jgi:hypothetical protein
MPAGGAERTHGLVPLAKRRNPPQPTVPLAKRGEPKGAGKGTTVRHEVFEAGAIFPSASVNRQVRCIALTPFVPLSRLRERGNALQGAPPCAPTPLSHAVGEGLGVRAKKRARLAHSELKRCTLIRPKGGEQFVGSAQAVGITHDMTIDRTYCTRARIMVNPLLKVPPASRGNRAGARLGSPRTANEPDPANGSPREAGGTLRRGALISPGVTACPPAGRGSATRVQRPRA